MLQKNGERVRIAEQCKYFSWIYANFSLCTHMEIRWLKLGKLYHARQPE